jgi:hypothetical protein
MNNHLFGCYRIIFGYVNDILFYRIFFCGINVRFNQFCKFTSMTLYFILLIILIFTFIYFFLDMCKIVYFYIFYFNNILILNYINFK